MDHRYLTISKALQSHAKQPIRVDPAVRLLRLCLSSGKAETTMMLSSGPDQADRAAAGEHTLPTPAACGWEEEESTRRFFSEFRCHSDAFLCLERPGILGGENPGSTRGAGGGSGGSGHWAGCQVLNLAGLPGREETSSDADLEQVLQACRYAYSYICIYLHT